MSLGKLAILDCILHFQGALLCDSDHFLLVSLVVPMDYDKGINYLLCFLLWSWKHLVGCFFEFVEGGFISGFSLGNGNVGMFNLCHILFRYDTLFCEANPNHFSDCMQCSYVFETISILKNNLVQSEPG